MNPIKLGMFHTQIMWDLLHDIHFIYDETEMAEFVVNKLTQALNVEGGTIFKVDLSNGYHDHCKIYPIATTGVDIEILKKQTFEIGKGVVGWVLQYMQPVKVENPDRDPRFYGGVDKVTGFNTASIIASPITAKNKPLGVLEFLNKRGGPFVIQDLELISMLGREVGIAMENIRLFKEATVNKVLNEALINSLRIGVLIFNDKGELANINPKCEEILKIKIPKKLLYNVALAPFPNLIQLVGESISSKKNTDWNKTNITIAGKEEVIYYSISSILDDNNNHLGTALLIQNNV